jgi:hypothetical protein
MRAWTRVGAWTRGVGLDGLAVGVVVGPIEVFEYPAEAFAYRSTSRHRRTVVEHELGVLGELSKGTR